MLIFNSASVFEPPPIDIDPDEGTKPDDGDDFERDGDDDDSNEDDD